MQKSKSMMRCVPNRDWFKRNVICPVVEAALCAKKHAFAIENDDICGIKVLISVPSKNVRGCKPLGFEISLKNEFACAANATSSQLKSLHAFNSPTENIVYSQ